jgi:hypothetical protein
LPGLALELSFGFTFAALTSFLGVFDGPPPAANICANLGGQNLLDGLIELSTLIVGDLSVGDDATHSLEKVLTGRQFAGGIVFSLLAQRGDLVVCQVAVRRDGLTEGNELGTSCGLALELGQ